MRYWFRGTVAAGILALALTMGSAAQAGDWSVVLNGKSVHVNAAEEWNEDNWGLGLEREFASQSPWVKVALANGFRDSQNAMSYMAGGGVKRRFRLRAVHETLYVDVGAVAFVMTRRDHQDNRPFPGVLPVFTVGARHVALNVTYMPKAAVDRINRRDPDLSGAFFIQLKLDAGLFRMSNGRTPTRVLIAAAD